MMKTAIVRTAEELKQAKENQVDEMIIIGKLANQLKKAKKITALSGLSIAVLTAATASIMTIPAATVSAPVTGGISAMVSGLTAATTTTAAVTLTGMEIATIIFISSVGFIVIIAIFKDYEEIEFSKERMVLRKRSKK